MSTEDGVDRKGRSHVRSLRSKNLERIGRKWMEMTQQVLTTLDAVRRQKFRSRIGSDEQLLLGWWMVTHDVHYDRTIDGCVFAINLRHFSFSSSCSDHLSSMTVRQLVL